MKEVHTVQRKNCLPCGEKTRYRAAVKSAYRAHFGKHNIQPDIRHQLLQRPPSFQRRPVFQDQFRHNIHAPFKSGIFLRILIIFFSHLSMSFLFDIAHLMVFTNWQAVHRCTPDAILHVGEYAPNPPDCRFSSTSYACRQARKPFFRSYMISSNLSKYSFTVSRTFSCSVFISAMTFSSTQP